ncbi:MULTISPECIES: zf-TFIIB domain-containing protein [Vibrio]|uniref:Transcription factor zinc-finger domain-containing protein n=2 Tax=Vibrio TaxID=662 RepID=A0A7X4RT97_9VIBR|nr:MULTISPECIES: zf-TFIIB domain-containing protein [Vibrio]MBF9003282.1 zf-TFIIB domain-containing protein [Vibrio nitrifigilis]MZI92005.1 hypothetical protein [Vibrio eleionomae]
MYCPKCKDTTLDPTKLEDGLPVLGCPQCAGSLLSLLHYRDWVERFALEDEIESTASLEAESDTKTALRCPKCGKIMTKYSVTGESTHRIDLCGSCDEAWLDGGEWQLLKSLALGDQLPKIFTQQWQTRVRTEKAELGRIERLTQMVGEDDATQAVKTKQWLKSNPNRASLLRYLASD